MTVVVLRHADAGDRWAWRGDDRLRALTAKGQRQAELLAETLTTAGSPLHASAQPATTRRHPTLAETPRVIASPFMRCLQTASPLAQALQVELETDERAGEGNEGSWIIDLLSATRPAVVCSHGDVIGDVLRRLQAAGTDLGPSPRLEKAGWWTLQRRQPSPTDPATIQAIYTAPPHTATAGS